MMAEPLCFAQTLAFGLPGWQELLILGICPIFMIGIVLIILYLTGVLGKRDKKD